MVALQEIEKAHNGLAGVARVTPLEYSRTLSDLADNDIYLKLENFQRTGSFKVRGAYYKISSLKESEKRAGVIAASAGNHAQGVAFAAAKANIDSTIVMPEGASIAKVEATRAYGANVLHKGKTFDEALEYALDLQQRNGAAFIHAFDDPKIIAGQGTVGLEILEQLQDVDAIVCPIGGGGLIAGVASTVKAIKPSVKIYGVQAATCASMVSSLRHHHPVRISTVGTIADGIAVKQPGRHTFAVVQKFVDEVCVVDDIEIARAMLLLLERNKILAEGSGAVALAALLYRKLPLQNRKVVPVISGGNIDVNFVSRIVERGLVESGRFVTLITKVSDKPGQLNRLLKSVSEEAANVISIQHHRISSRIMPGQTEIELSLETRDRQHIESIEERLRNDGYEFVKRT